MTLSTIVGIGTLIKLVQEEEAVITLVVELKMVCGTATVETGVEELHIDHVVVKEGIVTTHIIMGGVI